MSEQIEKKRPEIRGKVLEVTSEWRNNTGSFWKRDVIVETGYKYPNPLKVTFKKDATSHLEGVAEGDCVIIPYALDGRTWDGPNGLQYFVDIVGMGLTKIGGGTSGATAEKKPVLGCTAQTAIETWQKFHGDDKAAFAEFCKAQKPGKASKDYTIGDWAEIVNAIEAAATAGATVDDGTGDVEDLPF